MIYFSDYLPCKRIVEGILIEMNIRSKTKWQIISGYNPRKENVSYFLGHISKDFCDRYDLENLIKEPICFKNSNNPLSIDLMLTNRKNSFCNCRVIETGLSDCHKMTVY